MAGTWLPATPPSCTCKRVGKDRRYTWQHVPILRPIKLCFQRSTQLQAAAADGAYGGQWEQQNDTAAAAADKSSKGASMPATVFNLVNVIMGAGYVSIPFACRQGGWVALVLLWLLGCVFCYTGHALLQCCTLVDQENAAAAAAATAKKSISSNEPHQSASSSTTTTSSSSSSNSDSAVDAGAAAGSTAAAAAAVPAAGYEAVAGRAFGRLGLAIVSGIMYAELLGICCVYVVLEAETLATLLGSTNLGHILAHALGPNAFGLLASGLMVPTVLLPDLNALSVLGALGVTAAATVGLALAGLFVSSGSAAVPGLATTSFLQLQTLPQVLGVLAFVYAGHSTFPVIQQSMSTPSLGPRAVTLGYAITALICTTIGGFGYALYGSQTAAVITASLPSLSLVALMCTMLTLCNPFSAFALTLEPVAVALQQCCVVRQSKDRSSSSSNASSASRGTAAVPYPLRAAVRLGLALACCAIALALPYVADLMAFVGALLTMSVSLILPALFHVKLMGRQLPWWGIAFDGFVLLLGVACAAVGASSAMQSLQEKMALAATTKAMV